MESESGNNNGTPRFRTVRLFGVDITLPAPENGDSRRQPTGLQVQSLTISQLPNLIDSFAPGIARNPPFHSSIADGLLRSSSSVASGATGTMVAEEPEVAALPPPSPPHSHPHQPAVPPPLPLNATTDADANNPTVDAGNIEIMQVEIGLREAIGGNVDQDMVDAVVQLIEDTLEALEDNADHGEILNVHLSIELEEFMDDSNDQQEDHPGLSEEVIMSLLGTSTFETSSEDKDSCCICLDEFSTGDELGEINCDHKFHFMCILEWLKRNNICPICRAIALSVN